MLTLKAISVLEGNNKTDGFHLLWDPFFNGHLPLSGYSLWRKKSSGNGNKPVCRVIDGSSLDSLHNNFFLLLTGGEPIFDKITFRPMHSSFPDWPSPSSSATNILVNEQAMFAYDIFFTEPVFNVEIVTRIFHHTGFILAIAFLDNRIVRTKFLQDTFSVSFEEAVDKVTFYIPAMAGAIQICYTDPSYGKTEEWSLIKKDLCLPFQGFTPGPGTVQQEFDLFKSRLNDDLAPAFENFSNISSLLKKAFGFVKPMLLPATTAFEFMQPDNGHGAELTKLNAAPFAMLQTFSIYHNWRMGLGFGFLDNHALEENSVYDYKITANYHRNTLETIYDFHTVPINTRVGPLFGLAGLFFYVDWRTVVASFPATASVSGTFVKGIRVNGFTHVYFPQAVSHFAIYCVKDSSTTISIPAEGITLPVTERVEIKFGTPQDNIKLLGNFVLLGIAYPALNVGANPQEVVELVGYSFNNTYKNTPRLVAPAALQATNLQTQWTAGVKKAPEGLGFILSWQHPPADPESIDPNLWPPDCPLPPPPGELGYYKLEYKDRSLSPQEPWHLYDEKTVDDPTGVVLPGDDYTAPSLPLTYGTDLLDVFPAKKIAGGTFTTYQRFKHYLENRAGKLVAVPGDKYRYRIWSVDLTGRTSVIPRESNDQRLEKRQAPPSPAGLIDSYIQPHPDPGYQLQDPRTDLRPQHVYARIIQASSSNLSQQERDLLGERDHLTILTWTWGSEERSLDHYAKEFRVYFRNSEHGTIRADFTGAASPVDQDWNIAVNLSEPLSDNEFVGHYVVLQRNYFCIVSHGAGSAITIRLAAPRTAPSAVPTAGHFQLFRKPAGEESRPTSWDERIAVVPITDNFVYQYVLETGTMLTDPGQVIGSPDIGYEITALGQNTRCWLGVSAADTEPYIDDQLIIAGAFSPRHGNESKIVTAPVQVKFYGRPIFNPPNPLEDVDVLTLDEVNSDKLLFAATPIELMPFLHIDDQLRVERITGSDLLSLLHVNETGIQLSDAENPVIVNDWPLNPADEAELRNVFRSSNKPVPAKFIWAISKKNELHLDQLWKSVSPDPFKSSNTFKDYLPNRTERYMYRAKLVNEIGIPSESAALFPNVWRTPDKSVPPPVSIDSIQATDTAGGVTIQLIIKLDASLAAIVKGLLVFPAAFAAADNINDQTLNKAALLKIPNRPDLLSEQLYRVRVNGKLIEPVFIPTEESEKTTNGDSVIISWNEITFDFPFEQTVAIWAASVSNDNVLSPLGPFRKQVTGPIPPEFPDLVVETNAGAVTVSFNATTTPGLLYRLEKSEAAQDSFKPVTGWFVAQAGNNSSRFSLPAVTTSWRLKIRKQNNREYTGSPVLFIR